MPTTGRTDFQPSFNDSKNSVNLSFHCYYQNVNGLNSKTHEIFNSSSSCHFDLIALSETWLDERVNISEVISAQYNVFRSDRNFEALGYQRGGGVILAVRKEHSCIELNLDDIRGRSPNIDITGVQISIGKNKCFVFVLYIPPSLSATHYNNLFDRLEELEYLHEAKMLFIGDFNIPEYQTNHQNFNNSRRLLALNSFLNFFELSQWNSVPNYISRYLDLVISNIHSHVEKSNDPLLYEDRNHPAVEVTLQLENYNVKEDVNDVPTYNFRKANFQLLYENILNCDWSSLENYTDVNAACAEFYKIMYSILDSSVPKYIPRSNAVKYPAWFTKQIIQNLKKKYALWKEFKTTGCLEVYNQFSDLRSQIKREIHISHTHYLKHIENNIKNDSKSFWKYIQSKSNNSYIPNNMTYNNLNCDNMGDVVNAFADFFQSVFTERDSAKNQVFVTNNKNYHGNEYFHISCLQSEEVLKALKTLKPKHSKGPDGIPAYIVRDCAYAFVKPLTTIFNLSLHTGTFPNDWKKSRVCPVFKKGSKNCVENFRPITIICNFGKVFEIAIHNFLFLHVQKHITIHQHGFMKQRSTVTNLFCITQYIANNLDKNIQVDAIYTDLSKAFDRLDHDILLHKLNNFGISDLLLSFFKSYLTQRSQFVECRGFESKAFEVSSGVPQGSILGPLLFVIFINDIIEDLDVSYLLYADDVKIYYAIHSEEDCAKLQQNLNRLNNWCILNRLPLNINKCNVMTYSRKESPIHYKYKLNNHTLERPKYFKDLGVIFDPALTFNVHINNTINASYKMLGFIIRNSYGFQDTNVLMLLFNTFVKSKLEYCAFIWQSGYNKYIDSIERIQRKFLKFLVYKADGLYPPVGVNQNDLLSRFTLVSLEERRKVQSLLFLYKLINNRIDAPHILQQLCFQVHRIVSRAANTFHLPIPRTNMLKFSPLFFMCENCNKLQNRLDIFNCNIRSIKEKH